MTRVGKIGLVCCLVAGVVACTEASLAAFLKGLYEGRHSTYETCLYVSPDGSQLMPSLACDFENLGSGHSYEILGGDNAGTDQDGNPCGFGFGYDQPVPINGNSFEIEGVSSAGSDDEFSVNGTLSGDTATGTSTKVSGVSRCDIEWTATNVNGGTGGAGGDGGSGGDGGTGGTGGDDPIPGLEKVPECDSGEPYDFADGTFGSGWVDKLTETSPPESTYETRQSPKGGNPGRYYSIDLSNEGSMLTASTCVLSLNENATYDPAQMGPYTSIFIWLQASTPGSEFSSLQTAFSVAVVQGDNLYWSGADRAMVKFADGWVDHQMDQTQLRLSPSSTNLQAPDPDGKELTFGFITCVNGEREDSAVDNFIVRVCDTKEQ